MVIGEACYFFKEATIPPFVRRYIHASRKDIQLRLDLAYHDLSVLACWAYPLHLPKVLPVISLIRLSLAAPS